MTGPRPILDSGLGAGQGIWEVTTEPILRVGTRGSLPDGRVFYYARHSASGGIASPGLLLQSELIDAQNEDLAVNTAEIGDTSITVTFGTDTSNANDYTGGYACVIDSTGVGITYEIESHAAVTSGGSIVINLKDPIYVAFAAATTVVIMKNLWLDVIVTTADNPISPICGVNQVVVPAGDTNAQFFWCQTWGVTCIRHEALTAQGSPLVRSATAGRVGYSIGERPESVGIGLFTGTIAERGPVFLKVSQ